MYRVGVYEGKVQKKGKLKGREGAKVRCKVEMQRNWGSTGRGTYRVVVGADEG